MKTLGLDYERRKLDWREIDEPASPAPAQVLFEVREVGVCGTDRELTRFRFGEPPEGESFLVLGHEAIGQVVAVGSGVTRFRKGDWVVPSLRRSCTPACRSCARGRRDLCITGNYRERGIQWAHGYFARYAVDEESDLVGVPAELAGRAVLLEPMSVVEKAVETAFRLHPDKPESALVFGAGPIGVLAALVLQLRGLRVQLRSIEDASQPAPKLLESAGIAYSTGAAAETFDVIIEAAGAAAVVPQALAALAPLGVLIVLGAQDFTGTLPLHGLILGNRTMAGIVNSAPCHFEAAARDLREFPADLSRRIMVRRAFEEAPASILERPADALKLVHVMDD